MVCNELSRSFEDSLQNKVDCYGRNARAQSFGEAMDPIDRLLGPFRRNVPAAEPIRQESDSVARRSSQLAAAAFCSVAIADAGVCCPFTLAQRFR